jgi:hypothetical protein
VWRSREGRQLLLSSGTSGRRAAGRQPHTARACTKSAPAPHARTHARTTNQANTPVAAAPAAP